MSMRSGLTPLDERLGGLRAGGLYLLAGVPGSGRLVALLQFLSAGLSEGRVALVTAAPPGRIFEEGREWGIPLEEAWHDGRLRLVTLREDFERRMTSAADPTEVYEELGEMLGSDVKRLALFPGTPLWDSRAGTSLASRFLAWIEASGATTLATIGGTLEDATSPATEWVLQSAAGIFVLDVQDDGHRKLIIQRVSPAPADPGPIPLDLQPGKGFVAGMPRGSGAGAARPTAASRKLLLVNVADGVPEEVRSWARDRYTVSEADDVFRAVELVQEGPEAFGIILIHLDRSRISVARRACRAIRRLSPTPVILFSEEAVRASDRVRALESGANDFLSSPLSVIELASRVEHAIIAGGRVLREPAESPSLAGTSPEDGALRDADGRDTVVMLDSSSFSDEIRSRLDEPGRNLFTFVHLRPEGSRAAVDRLRQGLLDTIRFEDGDLAGHLQDGVGVLLEGASVRNADAFIQRLRSKLDAKASTFSWEAMSGSADRADIAGLLDPASSSESGTIPFPRTGT